MRAAVYIHIQSAFLILCPNSPVFQTTQTKELTALYIIHTEVISNPVSTEKNPSKRVEQQATCFWYSLMEMCILRILSEKGEFCLLQDKQAVERC